MSDSDGLLMILNRYGLENLFEKCVDNKILLQALLAFEESDLNVLTTYVGEAVLLRKLIRENKDSLGAGPRPSSSNASSASSSGSSSNAGTSSSSRDAGAGPSGCSSNNASSSTTDTGRGSGSRGKSSTQSVPSTSSGKRRRTTTPATAKLQRLDELRLISDLDLKDLLRSDETGGQHLLDGYLHCYDVFKQAQADAEEANEENTVPEPILSESQRAKLVEVIVDFLLSITKNPDHTHFPILTKKIVELFMGEEEKTYYIPPSKLDKRLHPTGKIPNRIRNQKSRGTLFKEFGPHFPATPGSSSSSSESLPRNPNLQKILDTAVTEEMQAAARWLANGRSPWVLVLQKWKLTSPIRFRGLFLSSEENYINTYLAEWTVLGHKSGHELILEDFNLLHSKNSNNLLNNWDRFVQKTIHVAERDIKDKVGKALLAEAKGISSSAANQNRLACLILRLLPFIRPNHTFMEEGKQTKASIDCTTNSYLMILQNECDLKEALKKRREASKNSAGWGEPIIILVLSKGKFNSVHLSIGTLRFKLESVVEAVDVYFKSFHALHINYPGPCRHILSMIQHALYGFSTHWDTDVNHSWIKSVKC